MTPVRAPVSSWRKLYSYHLLAAEQLAELEAR